EKNKRYEADIWTEVAKYLDGKDLARLGMTNRWFHRLIMEDSIWKYACLRDLQVPPPRHVSFTWKQLYKSAFDGSHAYCFRQQEKHIGEQPIGGFVLETPSVLLTEKLVLPKKLPKPEGNPERTIQTFGTCVLTNVRTGIWLAGTISPALHPFSFQGLRIRTICSWSDAPSATSTPAKVWDRAKKHTPILPVSTKAPPGFTSNHCDLIRSPFFYYYFFLHAGTMQVLDARHVELFLEEGYRNGSWEYEDIGIHRIEKPSDTATGGIFEIKYLTSPCTAGNHHSHLYLSPIFCNGRNGKRAAAAAAAGVGGVIGVLDVKSWIGQPSDWQPKARLCLHAVAVNTNLQPNEGLQVKFQAMRSRGADGEVVSIRISQQLI
ncbi:probable F-box protein At3g61730, partial [Phoenix dactylifera]|uniref:Probable F-box protein At3g61730 n=1 Tax=Phoenix dactylifera TaxID=42345 RepID=A0A8B8ZU12_PHODC